MKRAERYYQAFADLISEVKERCPDGRVVISEYAYEDEDGHIHVYPPDSWELDQCMELEEQMGAICSDRFLEGGPLILVMVVEPPDKVAQDRADFLAKRGYWQQQAS
ncbi:MAG: hypothetical protein ACYCOU_17245 [Sulfobacillus sp.]